MTVMIFLRLSLPQLVSLIVEFSGVTPAAPLLSLPMDDPTTAAVVLNCHRRIHAPVAFLAATVVIMHTSVRRDILLP